jgi:hypothetical protein
VEEIGSSGQTEELETPMDPAVQDAEGSRPENEPDSLATAARLVVGATSLGVDALASWLRSGRRPREDEPTTASTEDAASVSDTMIGAAARGVQAAVSVGSRGAELAGRGLRTAADGASKAVGWAFPTFLREPLDRARDRAADRMAELSEVGREELDRSRTIARAAIDDGLAALFARLADSRELQLVIRTQSASAAEETVDGLRSQAARFDDRLEIAARKLVGRRPKRATPAAP